MASPSTAPTTTLRSEPRGTGGGGAKVVLKGGVMTVAVTGATDSYATALTATGSGEGEMGRCNGAASSSGAGRLARGGGLIVEVPTAGSIFLSTRRLPG